MSDEQIVIEEQSAPAATPPKRRGRPPRARPAPTPRGAVATSATPAASKPAPAPVVEPWSSELFPLDDVDEEKRARYLEREAVYGEPTVLKAKKWDAEYRQWMTPRVALEAIALAEVPNERAFHKRFGGGRWQVTAYSVKRSRNGVDTALEPMRMRLLFLEEDRAAVGAAHVDAPPEFEVSPSGVVEPRRAPAAPLVAQQAPAAMMGDPSAMFEKLLERMDASAQRSREEERAAFRAQIDANQAICNSAIEMVKAAYARPEPAPAQLGGLAALLAGVTLPQIIEIAPKVMPFVAKLAGAATEEANVYRELGQEAIKVIGGIAMRVADAQVAKANALELDAARRVDDPVVERNVEAAQQARADEVERDVRRVAGEEPDDEDEDDEDDEDEDEDEGTEDELANEATAAVAAAEAATMRRPPDGAARV